MKKELDYGFKKIIMKKNVSFLLLVLMLFCFVRLQGQIKSSNTNPNCDLYPLWRLHLINEKVPLSEEKQKMLIEFFEKERKAFCDDPSMGKINEIEQQGLNEISKILSADEMELLLLSKPISKLNEVLLFQKKLNLTQQQSDSIEVFYLRAIERLENNQYFNVEKYDRNTLKRFLTHNQIVVYMKPKLKHRVGLKTLADWNNMLHFNLVHNTDSLQVWPIIESYNYSREVVVELYQDDRSDRNALLRNLDRDKDERLKKLDVAKKEDERIKTNKSEGIDDVKKFQGNFDY